MNKQKRYSTKMRLALVASIAFVLSATSLIVGCKQDVPLEEPEQEPPQPVTIKWDSQMTVASDGQSLTSGDQVLEGSTITITPTEGDPVIFLLAAIDSNASPIPLNYTGTQANYSIPKGAKTITFSLERQTLDTAPGENQARVIFVGNTSLPAGSDYSYANQIKTYWETGSSTRKANFDMQWPITNASDVSLADYVANTYKADFAKNPHGAVTMFGEAELSAATFDASIFTAQYAAILSGFKRSRTEATTVVVSLLPQSSYPNATANRWQEVDTAIRAAAKTAGATLVDLKALYTTEKDLASNQPRAQRRIAEEIFLGWYPSVEPYSVIPTDKDIPLTPQQKWGNGTMSVVDGKKVWTQNGNGNQDFTKYNLIKTIAEKDSSQWPQVIFTGDSITDFFDGTHDGKNNKLSMTDWWNENAGWSNDNTLAETGTASVYRALNLGNSGDFTQSLLLRWQNLPDNQYSGAYTGAFAFKDTVKAIVLNISTNNIGPGVQSGSYPQQRPIASVNAVRGIQEVVKILKEGFPKAKIILMGVFPRGNNEADPKDVEDFVRLQVLSVNRQLRDYYKNDARVDFTDLYEQFVTDDGKQRTGTDIPALGDITGCSNLFIDSVHPNNAGYKIWWDGIEPKLKKALGIK